MESLAYIDKHIENKYQRDLRILDDRIRISNEHLIEIPEGENGEIECGHEGIGRRIQRIFLN